MISTRGSVSTARRSSFRLNNRQQEAVAAILFLLPNLLGFFIFTLGPVIFSIFMSLTDWSGLSSPLFIGLANYIALASDSLFRKAVINTVLFTVEFTPLALVCALGVALLLNRTVRGIAFIRALYFFPFVVDMISISFSWLWIFQARYGILNQGLVLLGLPSLDWLGSVQLALPSLVLLSVWRWMGYYAIILLAGLQGIPRELYEAAKLDGAGGRAQFFSVTLPLLSPVVFFVAIVAIISSLQVFEQMYVMTQGGPMDSTLSISMILYQTGFQYFKMGYGSAMAWVLFFLIFVVTLVQWRVRGYWVYEG